MAGFALLLAAPIHAVAMSGFLLIGLGASNIVPVVFRGAGAQRAMPAGHAVAAITTAGSRAFSSVLPELGSSPERSGCLSRSGSWPCSSAP